MGTEIVFRKEMKQSFAIIHKGRDLLAYLGVFFFSGLWLFWKQSTAAEIVNHTNIYGKN